MLQKVTSSFLHFRQIWPYFLLLTMLTLLYAPVMNLWWTWDDTQILKHALKYHPWEYFFNPAMWRELTANNFTPLLTLSFDIDIALFRLRPGMFYLHHLAALWLSGVMLYIVLRLWLSRVHAFIGSSMFLIGLQTTVLSQHLMVRHYIEGLILALASLWFFVSGLRRNRIPFTLYSAFLYLGAVSAKEVYVPLVFFCLALPERDLKARFSYSLPLLIVFLLYLPWRWFMLGGSISGYSGLSHLYHFSSLQLFAEQAFSSLFGVRTVQGYVVLSIFLMLPVIFLLKKLRTVVLTICTAFLTLSPILTIPSFLFNDRHMFVLWVMLSSLLGFVSQHYWNLRSFWRVLGTAFVGLAMIGALLHSRPTWAHNLKISHRMGTEGKFFLLGAREDDILRMPVGSPWYYEGLNWLRQNFYGTKATPHYYNDDIYLCENPLAGKRVWSYSPDGKTMNNITQLIPDIRREYCNKVRKNTPMHVNIRYAKSQIFWEFGPYHEGTYSFILNNTGRYDVPSTGVLNITLQGDNGFRIRYQSPSGWIAYSPYLVLSVGKDYGAVQWENTDTGKP